MDNDAWKAQRTAEALDGLVQRQRMSQRLAALEPALAYEVEAHQATKNELTALKAKLKALDANTQAAVMAGDALALEVHGVELFVHHADGGVTGIYAKPDQDLSALFNRRDVQELEWQIEDTLKADDEQDAINDAEASHV